MTSHQDPARRDPASRDPAPRVLVVGDAGDDDTGFVGERLRQHGYTLTRADRDRLPSYADVACPELLLLLGSARSGHASENREVVGRESRLVLEALDDGVGVLGICYGAQLLAHALGGTVGVAAVPEIGFFEVESLDPVLCPPGPWAQVHSDAFTAPPTARLLGRSPAGAQAFTDESRAGRAIAWQYHLEVTPAQLSTWLDNLADYVAEHGGDAERTRAEASARENDLRDRAYALTDAALTWLSGSIEGELAG